MPPKKVPKALKPPVATTIPGNTLPWAGSIKDELAKLRKLMQQQFVEASKYPQYDPNLVLVDASIYGGTANHFILCRNVDGKILPLDPENENSLPMDLIKQESVNPMEPIIAMEVPDEPESAPSLIENFFDDSLWNLAAGSHEPEPMDIPTESPINPLTDQSQVENLKPNPPVLSTSAQNFFQQGIGNLNMAQYPYTAKPRKVAMKSTKGPTLISVVTSKGKRIDLDNTALINFQKKADGHGMLSFQFLGDDVILDVNEIVAAVKSGKRAISIKENKNPIQTPKTIQKQLTDLITK